MRRHPTFIILGAAKCATRWICQCLTEHPEVFIPVDEPFYFCRNYDPKQPMPPLYLNLFDPAGTKQIIGENSNTYLTHRMVPRRLYQSLPDIQLLFSFRNPIDRAYSDYCMHLRRGEISREIERYLDPDKAIMNDFLEKGFYLEHIERYECFYPRDRFHVVIYDDLKSQPLPVFSSLFKFLGVDSGFEPPSLETKVNTKQVSTVPTGFKHGVVSTRLGRKAWDVGRAVGAREVVRRVFAKPFVYPPLPPTLRDKLKVFYRDETVRLSGWLDRDLTHWVK